MTSSVFIYVLTVEKDFVKALLILNVITNYRMILFFLSDIGSEIMNKNEVVYKIPAEKFVTGHNRTLSYPISDDRPEPIYYSYDIPLGNQNWWEVEA